VIVAPVPGIVAAPLIVAAAAMAVIVMASVTMIVVTVIVVTVAAPRLRHCAGHQRRRRSGRDRKNFRRSMSVSFIEQDELPSANQSTPAHSAR